uniref:C-type lectin domain-containing protein n=1 Tax=Seriola dumerili TaxID=41447 RepID=A0A3B4U9P7_SERDU
MLKKSSSSGLFIITLNFIFNHPLFVQPSHQSRRYVHQPRQVTWSEAQTYCREHHTDLATFTNMHELDAAQSLYSSQLKSWIGLQRDNNDPDVWRWSDGRSDNFTHWNVNSNEPNGLYNNENCAVMKSSWWFDVPCNLKFTFLCYEDDLILVKENKTWEEALKHCRTLDMNPSSPNTDINHLYDLPNIYFGSDNSFIKRLILDAQTDEVWIGLRFLAGHWLWVNGIPLQEQLPACPAPGNHCGTILRTVKLLQLRNCLERRNFMCLARN